MRGEVGGSQESGNQRQANTEIEWVHSFYIQLNGSFVWPTSYHPKEKWNVNRLSRGSANPPMQLFTITS
jgi:hypothetical protein